MNSSSHRSKKPSYSDRLIGSYSVTKVLPGHSGCVNSVEYSQDGSLLMTGSDDRSVCIYGADDGAGGFGMRSKIQLRHDANIFNAVFLPSFPNKILSCALDGKTVLTELQGGGADDNEAAVGRVLFNNASTLASKIACHPSWTQTAFVGYGDGNIVWLDLRTSELVETWNPHRACVEEINAMAVHPSHPYLLAVGTNTHLVYLMDVRMVPARDSLNRNQGRIASGFVRVPDVQEGRCEGIGGLSFSSRGAHLCVNFKSNDVYSVPWQRAAQSDSLQQRGSSTDIGIIRYRGRRNEKTMFKEAIFFHDDKYIVTGGDSGDLYFWQSATGRMVHHTKGDGDIVNGVLAHESRPHLICSGIDNTAKVLNAKSDIAHHAPPPSPELFGTRHLGGRRRVTAEPLPPAFFSSDDDNGDSSISTEEDPSAQEGNEESVIAQCEAQNLSMWMDGATFPAPDINRQKEQLRVLCMAFSRHMHYFLDSSDAPLMILKRMVAISQAVRQMHDNEEGAGPVVFSSSDDDYGDDWDEEGEDGSDAGSETNRQEDGDDDNHSANTRNSDVISDDESHVNQMLNVHGEGPPAVGDDEIGIDLRVMIEPPSSVASPTSGLESSDDEASDVDSPSMHPIGTGDDEEHPLGISTLVPVALMVVEKLLEALDALLRQAVDDGGSPMFSLHWWSCVWGGASNCEVLPLSARKAKLILLLVEAVAGDKIALVESLGSPREVMQWKKIVCRILLRRIYFELSRRSADVALQLCDRCQADKRFEGLSGLGPWSPKRSRSNTRRQVIRVVPLALKLRILQISAGETTTTVSDAVKRAEIVSLLRRVTRRCRASGAIARHTVDVLQAEDGND